MIIKGFSDKHGSLRGTGHSAVWTGRGFAIVHVPTSMHAQFRNVKTYYCRKEENHEELQNTALAMRTYIRTIIRL